MGSVSSPNAATVSRNSPSGSVSDPATDSVSDYFPSIINQALVDIDMDFANGVSDLPNQGTGGSDYDLDTNVGTEANRKLHPTGSCLLFGANSDYPSAPDYTDPSGDFTTAIRLAADDWTPSGDKVLAAHFGAAGNYAWLFRLNSGSSGTLQFFTSNDGTALKTFTSTVAPTDIGS